MATNEKFIEQDYSNYYEGYQFVNGLDAYLPLVKMDLMMEYTCNAPIGTLESYMCTCIRQGITDRYGIIDVLDLDDHIVNDLIDKLIKMDIVKEEGNKLSFTKEEYKAAESIKSLQHKKQEVSWCYKGLMNADKKIDTHMKSIEQAKSIVQVVQQEKCFYLLPNVVIEVRPEELKAISPKMLYYPNQKQEEILEVKHLEILKERTALYEHYKILFYRGSEGDVKVLVHRADEEQKVDKAFTKTIQRLSNRSELFNQLRYTSPDCEKELAQLSKQISSMFNFK
ncbi:MAG: hypothetical protein J6F30_06770 [Cellulosilyticum sp.]|nr:hypothetical protein [Cellulosilyticum sp.]